MTGDTDGDRVLAAFLAVQEQRNPGKPEFLQAVAEVAASVSPLLARQPALRHERILERLAEPDRIVSFRVCWEDDAGNVRVNRGYRVQHSNAIGPYKGGLRFHPGVTLDTLQALAFEQTFKNCLTGLPMGGAKGGADFDPRSHSDREVMRFCQSFMTELHRHIGADTDVPAGDIGVGSREIGFLFGQHKRVTGEFTASMTGKGIQWGGSEVRAEATGYGVVYFLGHVLARDRLVLADRRVTLSGAGNVALHAAEKLAALGARVVTLSDSDGTLRHEPGLTVEQIAGIKQARLQGRRRLDACARELGCEWLPGAKPWATRCDIAIPCATQNELDASAARHLVQNGCRHVVEGANLPVTPDARAILAGGNVTFAPGKAANAGGVAVSGLEMTQNRMSLPWDRQEIDDRLQHIMSRIFEQCLTFGTVDGKVDYTRGANRAAFSRLADALLAFGIQ